MSDDWKKICPNYPGLSMYEALQRAQQERFRIPSSKEHSQRLVHTDIWKSEKEMYTCWTGTFAAFNRPSVPFGKTWEWEGLKVNIPKEFQGKSDIVLLCNHPDFTLSGNTITFGKSVKSQSVPPCDAWHDPDPEFEFPTGESKDYDERRRYLYRLNSGYAGLVARGRVWYGGGRRNVGCYYQPSDRLGVFGVPLNAGKHKHEWETKCRICGESK